MIYDKNHPLRVCTLCSGYDSQCLALKYLKDKHSEFDFDLVAWSEIEDSAIKAHNLLFPEYDGRNLGDMSKIEWEGVEDFDLLTYSTPCQSVSTAGKRNGIAEGSGTRSSLLWYTRNAIIAKKPKYLLMENVKGLVSEKFRPYFFAWLKELESYGYDNFYKVLNAKDYGIPQNRERIFVISIRRDGEENIHYHFPKPQKLELKVEDVIQESADEKYYLKSEYIKKFVEQINVDTLIEKAKNRISLPKTADGCSPTITTRSGNCCLTNMISTTHYPMGGQLGFKKLDYVINQAVGGVSKTLLTSYHKVSLANYLHDDGRAANAVLNIKKV